MDLSFIENIKFDPTNRYILGFGENKIFILDFENNKGEIIILFKKEIEKVNDASIRFEDGRLRCLTACKKVKLRQVIIFDILENHKFVEKYVQKDPDIFRQPPIKNPSIRTFNLQFDTTEFIKVKISSDLDSIVLTDLQEKFILTELNGSILQRKLTKFEGKVVHFIQEASNG